MAVCTVADCDREFYCRGLCRRHYEQWRRGAQLDAPLQRVAKGRYTTCTIDGCGRPHRAHRLCQLHYHRLWSGRSVTTARTNVGEGHPRAKLTADRVRAIRQLRAEGWTLRRLAAQFGVSGHSVHAIVDRRTWRNVV
ncbi:hypothetical protein FHT40_006349 [Mycolicibacterium sp. BK556]|nr:hypothetical protein [Mycolicibacterium sp. BK556]MBB3636096.1 hypothetical protein [Mycolicibacterium sp. BK607]